jgi:hypothetical protein
MGSWWLVPADVLFPPAVPNRRLTALDRPSERPGRIRQVASLPYRHAETRADLCTPHSWGPKSDAFFSCCSEFSVRLQLSTCWGTKASTISALTFDFLVNKFSPSAFQSRSQLSKKLPSSDLFFYGWMVHANGSFS